MLRQLSLLVAALALASCTGTLSKDDCAKAAEAGTWDVTFAKSSGPSTCPTLQKSFQLPNHCEANCGCTEAAVVFEPAPNTARVDSCTVRLQELCPGYELNCYDVELVSATLARGTCYYRPTGETENCGYRVDWVKKQ